MRSLSERWSLDHAIKGVCLLVSVAVLVSAAWARGPWLDEFWSSWLSDPNANLSRAFIDRWMVDVHPPLFVFLHYAIRQFLDFDIFGGRLVNIALLAGTFPLFLYIRRRSSHAPALDLFAVSALTLEMFVEQILDFRSYTAVGCAVFLLLTSAFVLFESGERSRPAPDGGIWAIFAVAALVGVNLHYIAGMYIDFFGATLAGAFLISRRTRDFCRVAAILCVANAPLLTFAAAQRDYIVSCIVGGLWIDVSSYGALIVTADGLRDAMWVPLGLLALGCVLNRIWPTEHVECEGQAVGLRFAVVLVVATIAFIGFVLLLHTIVSLVQGRYLMPAFFALQFALICAVPQRFYRLGARDAVYSVVFAAIVTWHATGFAQQQQWKDLSARVRELKAACPGSRVYTGVWWVVATPNLSETKRRAKPSA